MIEWKKQKNTNKSYTSFFFKIRPIGSSISAKTRIDLARLEICMIKKSTVNEKRTFFLYGTDIETEIQISHANTVEKIWQCLALPGLKANRATNDLLYPASSAAATSASFSVLISSSLSSKASAMSSRIFFLSWAESAC